ncbi:hypothetical protein C8034_v003440 [Colletotrichum sidae]|uniref:Uncharacterized protein n=1 Tax=Colletotrichum sidae TaxID=1347389 RepID=A0A4R8TAH5_9PEZI|nr:hypothetical protein C8034_v003440 [Colletotrichum sidae]
MVRRRIIRRSRFPRPDLRVEIRDGASDSEDSPSPSYSSFSKSHSPKTKSYSPKLPPPQPAPPVLNPARPGEAETTTTSSSSSSSSLPTAPSRQPSRDQPQRQPTSNPPVPSAKSSSSSSSSSSRPAPTAIPNGQFTTSAPPLPTNTAARGGNQAGLGKDRSREVGWTPTAIAFGTIAIAAFFLVIGLAIWWFLKYRRRRQARQMYENSISSQQGTIWNPVATFSPPTHATKRSPSSVMAELMGHAYAAENGHAGAGPGAGAGAGAGAAGANHPDRNLLTPQGYLDEKKFAADGQLPILEPAPVHQPQVRNSVASWIRRHHPLKLNPHAGRSSMYSTRTAGASTRTVNVDAPPVPAVPDAYRPSSRHSGLAVPGGADDRRYTAASSRYGSDAHSLYGTNSILSLYENQHPTTTQQQQQQQQQGGGGGPPDAPWLETPPPLMYGERGVSMAPTESTWRSWGGGVTQPREHAPAPPQTPRRGWIEKCIKFGGLK